MTLEEAIELNNKLLKTGNYDVDPKYTKAIALGIEALKAVKNCQDTDDIDVPNFLPGQTEEYCKVCGIVHTDTECPEKKNIP